MALSLIEECRDIDWFCIINNIPVHIATAGGILPNIMKTKNNYKNNISNGKIINSIKQSEIPPTLNPKLKEILFGNKTDNTNDYILSVLEIFNLNIDDSNRLVDMYIEEIYAKSFIEFAQKGFCSFDKTNINDPYDGMYHLVAKPNITVELNNFKLNLPEIYIDNFCLCDDSFNLIDLINSNNNH